MTGRHRATSGAVHHAARNRGYAIPRRRNPRRARIVVALLAGVLLVVGAAASFGPRLFDATARGHCSDTLHLPVITAPAIAPAVTVIVQHWQRSEPSVSHTCIRATVTTRDSFAAEQALVQSDKATVWIPESTVWRSQLISDVPSLAPLVTQGQSVATTPLVIATTPGHAATVAASAKSGWWSQLAGASPVAIADPTHNAEAALALVSYSTALGSSPKATNAFAGTALRLTAAVMPTAATGFANLRTAPASAKPFLTTEQQVLRTNKRAGYPVAAAVYPRGTGLALDFPVVAITPATNPTFVRATDALTAQLRGTAGQHQLGAIGLRDPSGAPLTDVGSHSDPVAPTVITSVQRLADAMKVWIAARRATAVLAVVDVSGSMNGDSGNGRSKIDVAAEAATSAMRLLPDRWSAGLWTFASRTPQPWTQLVPLASVASQRAALIAATESLPRQVGGNTALYATTLAAFNYLTAHYAPDRVDTVVLMTDGGNSEPGLDLHTLLADLRHGFNRDKPVSITTIALGGDADVAALRQISAATGGRAYVLRSPKDLETGLLQSVLRGS